LLAKRKQVRCNDVSVSSAPADYSKESMLTTVKLCTDLDTESALACC
jgi:hypothetical protein